MKPSGGVITSTEYIIEMEKQAALKKQKDEEKQQKREERERKRKKRVCVIRDILPSLCVCMCV